MPTKIAVVVEKPSNRLQYVLDFVLKNVCGLEWKWYVQSGSEIPDPSEPILIYGQFSDTDFSIPSAGLLYKTGVKDLDLWPGKWGDLPCLFCSDSPHYHLNFDLFSAVFYCISRYEEYLPFEADEHGRFPHTQSVAFKLDFLKRPLVNEWIYAWLKSFSQFYGHRIEIPKPKTKYLMSIDVDNSFAFEGKGIFRNVFGLLNDVRALRFEAVNMRLAFWKQRTPDPFNNYEFQLNACKEHGVDLLYFLLFSEFDTYDRNLTYYNNRNRQLARYLADEAQLGAHPSYRSNQEFQILHSEIKALNELTHLKVEHSRQHYLKLKFPETYENLMKLEVGHDYSMGYSRETGWRASTSSSFNFYHLGLEKTMPLQVHPFPFMDSVYFDQKKWSAKEAHSEIFYFLQQVKEFGGSFIPVFHNRTFSEMIHEWKGWRSLYIDLLKAMK